MQNFLDYPNGGLHLKNKEKQLDEPHLSVIEEISGFVSST